MGDLALALRQTRYSLTGFLRSPRAFVFTIVMPLFLLVILNTIFHNLTDFVGTKSAALYYTPAMISYQIIWAGVSSLSVTVVADREAGLLKRFRGTPMPPWVYLAAETARTTVVVVCTVIVLLLVAVAFYGVRISMEGLLGLGVYTVVGTATMSSLGLAATRVCSTTDSASVVSPFAVVILAFISGAFVPVELMPNWLMNVGRVFPLEHLAAGLRIGFTNPSTTGISAVDLGALALWGIGGALVAVWSFRWEPLGPR